MTAEEWGGRLPCPSRGSPPEAAQILPTTSRPMRHNGEPAVKLLKTRSLAILGLLLVMLGALSLYQGIAHEGPIWLSWVRGSLAMVSGLGLVVVSLNPARCRRALRGQPIFPRLSRDANLDATVRGSGGTALGVKGTGPKRIATG